MRMRQLDRWSDSSLRITAPRPCQGEPSRRMPRSFIRQVLEIAGVDHLEARQIGYLIEPPAGLDHRDDGFRPNVAIGEKPEVSRTGRLDGAHARHPREPVAKPLPFRLDLDRELTAQHL